MGHIEEVNETKDDVFIQPTVITANRVKSKKIALDARIISEKKKDKHQRPNLDDLLSILVKIFTQDGEGQVWFTSVDL